MPGPKPRIVFLHGVGGAARVGVAQVASFDAAGFTAAALNGAILEFLRQALDRPTT
jgi:hypothetical protein